MDSSIFYVAPSAEGKADVAQPLSAHQNGSDAGSPVRAKGRGRIVSQTANGAVTEGKVWGSGLRGTTLATLQFTGVDPATGNLWYGGTITLTNRRGTLTFELVNGILNTTTGEFSNDATATVGTGAFAGASGRLYFHGVSYPDGCFIDDKIEGRICFNPLHDDAER